MSALPIEVRATDPPSQAVELNAKVLRMCRNRWQGEKFGISAEDIAQEVMLAIHTSAGNRAGVDLERYVSGIVAHKIADAHRVAYGRASRELPVDLPPDIVSVELADNSDLLAALSGLTERQRAVLVLRHLLGYSVDDTAELMATTPEAVRIAAHRALATARRMLTEARYG